MNPRQMAAIMTGCLSHREARVLLAVAFGAWSAGSAARATGLDRAHCTRAIRSLASASWLRRDAAGRVLPVDNLPPVIEAVTLSVENGAQRRRGRPPEMCSIAYDQQSCVRPIALLG